MASTFFTLFQAGDFQAALQVAEAYPPGHRRDRDIGTALLALRRASEAVSSLRRAVDADPTQPEIWRNLGMAEEHMDRPAAALEAFETAAGLSPQPRLTSAIARNLRQIGRVAEGE
ncbi:MAG: tetratricopeptide repeat protein, partial [Pseudomonadota bacterium]